MTMCIIAVIVKYNQIITNVWYIDTCLLVILVEVSAKVILLCSVYTPDRRQSKTPLTNDERG